VTEDPRSAIVEVMARLGRETQLHLDERHRHFQITDAVIITISVVLVILAVFNIYYVRVLYKSLDVTVSDMELMYGTLRGIDNDMRVITQRFETFDLHMAHMTPINENITSLAETLPRIRGNMDEIASDMTTINREMDLVRQAMANMDPKLHQMGAGVSIMRQNMRQISGPMGFMNPMLP